MESVEVDHTGVRLVDVLYHFILHYRRNFNFVNSYDVTTSNKLKENRQQVVVERFNEPFQMRKTLSLGIGGWI